MTDVQFRRHDGTWGYAPSSIEDGLGANEATRTTARGILLAHVLGYAVKDVAGTNAVIKAFINPRTGALDRDALQRAAELLLAERQ